MLEMTKEEFIEIAAEVVTERTHNYLEGKYYPELGLLFILFGLNVVGKIVDKIYGEENNESQS